MFPTYCYNGFLSPPHYLSFKAHLNYFLTYETLRTPVQSGLTPLTVLLFQNVFSHITIVLITLDNVS